MLKEGDAAPDFEARDAEGNAVKLSDLRGRKVVLYFYPKDDTPGCTKEACSFRDGFAEFKRRGIEVLGVSTDDEKSHRKFAEKFSLPFKLLADTDHSVADLYEVYGEKHPQETDARHLLWSRDPDFYKHYYGKPCVFGHTPTPLLPLLGRLGRHGIYVSHSAIGIDTGYDPTCALTCLQLPEFNLYQTFADGRTAHFHMTNFLPEPFRKFQRNGHPA